MEIAFELFYGSPKIVWPEEYAAECLDGLADIVLRQARTEYAIASILGYDWIDGKLAA